MKEFNRYNFVYTDNKSGNDESIVIHSTCETGAREKFYDYMVGEDISNVEVEEFTLQKIYHGVHTWQQVI